MNFALSALVIVLLLLPGAAIQRSYYSSLREKKSSINVAFAEVLFRGIIWSTILHVAGVCIIRACGYHVEFKLLYAILAGKDLTISDVEFSASFTKFLSYILLLSTVCFFATKWLKNKIENRNLDIKFFSLRNKNYWFHIFSARYLETPGVPGDQKQADLIMIDVLTDSDIIYTGFLVDFNYSPVKDELENVVLTSANKRVFKPQAPTPLTNPGTETQPKSGPQASIKGDVFVIPSSKIKNINIHYLNLGGLLETTPQSTKASNN